MSNQMSLSNVYKLCGIDHKSWGCTRPSNEKHLSSGCPEKSSEDVQRLYQRLLPKGATITTSEASDDYGKYWVLEWKRGMVNGSLRLKV